MDQFLAKLSLNKLSKLIAISTVMAVFFVVLSLPAQAEDPLTIFNISAITTDDTATLFWETNRRASAKLEYGREPGQYIWTIIINDQRDRQAITLTGLQRDQEYFFKLTVFTANAEVSAFERRFETLDFGDNIAPRISDVHVAYLTGTTATIQWLTDEPASSVVEYGTTEALGKTKTSSSRKLVHDVTLSRLTPGQLYYYRVKSKDEDDNIIRWQTLTFRPLPHENAERDPLTIYSVQPSAQNNINIGQTTAVISWRTNKLASATVRYGVGRTNKSVKTIAPRVFDPSITLIGLTPGTTYTFDIEVKDVFGRRLKSEGHNFTTKSSGPIVDPADDDLDNFIGSQLARPTGGFVLGASSCSVNLDTDIGHFGIYYNLTTAHPETELWKGSTIPNNRVARENDWYNPEYFAFTRIDPTLNFEGRFLPVDEGKAGDPYHFAVNWRSIFEVPQDGNYSYTITSDDDSWVFIDGQLMTNLGGVHRPQTDQRSVSLGEGFHTMEIYYAERSKRGAIMNFVADSRLRFHPLPEGCSLNDVLLGTKLPAVGGPDVQVIPSVNTPTVLGVSTDETITTAPVCSNDRGYTKFTALYKTTNSPDIWAILETGQKHYITSPESFAEYGCRWNAVQIVSQAKLNSFDHANLVRTPNNATIYHLFQRPQLQWLKINIPSPTVFISYSDNFWGNVARINQLDMASYPAAELIRLISDDTYYKIEGLLKRKFASHEAFESLGYDVAEVVELNAIHLDSYEDGVVID